MLFCKHLVGNVESVYMKMTNFWNFILEYIKGIDGQVPGLFDLNASNVKGAGIKFVFFGDVFVDLELKLSKTLDLLILCSLLLFD